MATRESYTTAQLLIAEANHIRHGDGPPAVPEVDSLEAEAAALKAYAHWADQLEDRDDSQGLAALCLSGGGIRSASFALGLLQVLADKGLLGRFDYLSTVSGGGYIGSALSRWIADVARTAETPEPQAAAVEHVQHDLASTLAGRKRGDPPPHLIAHIREYSNFLTPRLGLASGDLWTSVVLTIRNLLINWSAFGPSLLLLAFLPVAYDGVLNWGNAILDPAAGTDVLASKRHALYIAAALVGWAVAVGHHWMPSHEGGGVVARSDVRLFIVVPIVIAAFLLPVWLSSSLGDAMAMRPDAKSAVMAQIVVAFVIAGATGGLIGELLTLSPWGRGISVFRLGNVGAALLASFGSAGLLALGAWLWFGLAETLNGCIPSCGSTGWATTWTRITLAVAGPTWVLLASLLHATIYARCAKVRARRPVGSPIELNDDPDREWLARAGALKVVPALSWLLLAFASLAVPGLLLEVSNHWDFGQIATFGTTAVSGLITVLGGSSDKTGPGSAQRRKSPLDVAIDVAVPIAAPIFAIGLFALFAWAEAGVLDRLADAGDRHLPGFSVSGQRLWLAAAGLALLAIAAGWLPLGLNINRFSLHGVYRNRLMRAFLGASRWPSQRQPDAFTGFDVKDNMRLHELRQPREKGQPLTAESRRPLYHVLGACLNVTRGGDLAWQERKAAPYILSPLACGSAELRRQKLYEPAWGAYVDSEHYGSNEPDSRKDDQTGISLATAMTISGAAFNPAQGYHSSPLTAFFLTLFDVRLGCWLPNPDPRHQGLWNRGGPKFPLELLLNELTGSIGMDGPFLQLSDGGHFDNLGLYEMVRRRCRYILVSDAAADPHCMFDDLGMTIRKIRVDLDTEISFERLLITARDAADANSTAIAIGKIAYPPVQGGQPTEGLLIYVKASYALLPEKSFFYDVPVDIRYYASMHADFPHESTADQWFSESQFEAYRRLGEFVGQRMTGSGSYDHLRDLFKHVGTLSQSRQDARQLASAQAAWLSWRLRQGAPRSAR